jgi:hypothetical protein
MPLMMTEEATGYDGALAEGEGSQSAIDRLRPNSPLHADVLEKLMTRIKLSQRHMGKFYERWRANELQYQAYMKTETFEQLKKSVAKTGTAPELVTITIPYTYATVQTIVTYLLHTFCGRAPMFQVGARAGERVGAARNMETFLQYNGDHERIVRRLFQYFFDGEVYGLQAVRVQWKREERVRTLWKPQNVVPLFGRGEPKLQPVKESAVTFEGNEVRNIDPYRFLPDPRVPMDEVNIRGEFVFWEEYEGKHSLQKAEKDGFVKWIKDVPGRPNTPEGQSQRGRLSGGGPSPGADPFDRDNGYHLFQGTVDLCPSEWGLGDSDTYEKWIFTIANSQQIIQAEPLDLDHNRHPVIVGEPYSSGYEFGNMAAVDMLGPVQEMLSWMFNSHIFNVRAALNNTYVVNPNAVDIEDLKKPVGAGRVVKLKPQAFGQDIRNVFHQVPTTDVTSQHINDMQVVQRFGDLVSSVNDNLRGVINSGGRKSATEVRQGNEAGASRLAAHARLISAQTLTPFAEMETLNIQQLLSEPVWLKVLGQEGAQSPLRVGPEDLSGDFYFPVHDGTLPLDRVALLDVWREIFMAIIGNPLLAQQYDANGIFEYLAELGGAKNLSTFKVQAAPNEQVQAQVDAGNMIPAMGMPR